MKEKTEEKKRPQKAGGGESMILLVVIAEYYNIAHCYSRKNGKKAGVFICNISHYVQYADKIFR